MSKSTITGLSAGVLTAAAVSVLASLTAEGHNNGKKDITEKPNIIFFLVDDMGWQDTSVQLHSERTLLNDRYNTPGMEYLAENGITFTNAYSAPICSPTRTSIMTGMNPARHNVTNWTFFEGKYQDLPNPEFRMPEWNNRGIQPGESLTLAEGMKLAGYKTIHAGKAHWGAHDTPGENPLNLGFDINIAGHATGAPGSYYGTDNFGNNPDGTPAIPWGVPGLNKYHGQDVNLTDVITAEAIKEINKAAAENQPFYLYMAHYAVHTPIMPHKDYVDKYLEAGLDTTEAAYASLVESVDNSLVQLIEALKANGTAENTIILFGSDNGGLSKFQRGKSPYGGKDTHNYPLREGKGSAYEGGTRVPLIVAPALRTGSNFKSIAAAEINDTPVICEDYYPTILELAGFANHKKVTQKVDGISFVELLDAKEKSQRFEARPLIFHTPNQWTHWTRKHDGYRPHSSVRLGDWKAIYFYNTRKWEGLDHIFGQVLRAVERHPHRDWPGSRRERRSQKGGRTYDQRQWELYNLKDDISESVDLSEEKREKLHQMQQILISELEKMNAQFMIRKRTGKIEYIKN